VDLEHDGDLDIVGVWGAQFTVLVNEGYMLPWRAESYGTVPESDAIALADFDGDGDVDLITGGGNSNALSLIRNASVPPTGSDCNGNGRLDECDIRDGLSRDQDRNGVPDECECLGDLDGDGVVGQADLAIVLADFGCNDPIKGCRGDVNNDRRTDQADLALLLADYGRNCGGF
jgi:hypothetical protein